MMNIEQAERDYRRLTRLHGIAQRLRAVGREVGNVCTRANTGQREEDAEVSDYVRETMTEAMLAAERAADAVLAQMEAIGADCECGECGCVSWKPHAAYLIQDARECRDYIRGQKRSTKSWK